MNRRMALLAAVAIALGGAGAVAARQLGGSKRSEGKVTLKSRILDYEKNFRTMRSRPSPKETDEHITAMMGEYFRIGMSYEEVIKTLGENDLTVHATDLNARDERFPPPAHFDIGVFSIIKIPTMNPFINFRYTMLFGFQKNKLDDFGAVRAGTGP